MKKTYSISTMFMIGAVLFWCVPVLSGFLEETQRVSLTRAFVEIIQPFYCLASGYVYTKSTKFSWYLPIGIMLLFLPVCFIYYSFSTLLLIPVYGGLNLFGCIIARFVIHREKN